MDNKKHKIVLGTFFGDEGKGNVVQWLCQNSEKPIVHRFSGGPQAGHRVVLNGKSHVCSSWGSGVLLGVPTYLNENVFVDPICIVNEYKTLVNEGIKVPPLYINQDCRVVTPYDVLADSTDSKVKKDGTCGKGIHATFKRYEDNTGTMRFAGALDPWNWMDFTLKAEHYYKYEVEYELCKLFKEACEFIDSHPETFKFVGWSPAVDQQEESNYDTVIWEGSQGLLLDMERGFMPNCTPSKTGLNGIPEYVLKESPEVYLVMRPYLTRHGNGYDPYCPYVLSDYFVLDEPTNIDTGPQGVFKRGIFNFDLLERVINRHCLDNYQNTYKCLFNVVITHWDCLKLNVIPLVTSNGETEIFTKPTFIDHLDMCSINLSSIYLSKGEDSDISAYKARHLFIK